MVLNTSYINIVHVRCNKKYISGKNTINKLFDRLL